MARLHTLLFAATLTASLCAVSAGNETSLTIYSSADPAGFNPQQFIAQQRGGFNYNSAWGVPGFGVVKQVRDVNLKKGVNEVPFSDVARFLDPTTVSFRDLSDAGTQVLEQSFKFDLVSPTKLLESYLDKNVTVSVQEGNDVRTVSGTLLSANQGQLVLKAPQGLEILPAGNAQVRLGSMPEGFLTKPTLLWLLDAKTGGKHQIRTTYQTGGLTWRADYNLVLNAADTAADMTAWVSILNVSGMSYPDTNLKLVAGDVQRVVPKHQRMAVMERAYGASDPPVAGFEEKAFFEYHLYTLPRKTSILSNMTQQLTLFPAVQGMSITKELLYAPTWQASPGNQPNTNTNWDPAAGQKVGVYVSFKNDKDNKMGMPLPGGRLRAYKEDPDDGTLEFVGEALINHTPRNETVRFKLGNAFDVVGERTRTDFSINKAGKTMSESIKIEIRNQKDVAQSVVIRERLFRWKNWDLLEKSAPYKKLDANTIEWKVDVPPEGSRTITYTVKYTW